MVVFVDELLFHITPLMFRRQTDPKYKAMYAFAGFNDGAPLPMSIIPGGGSGGSLSRRLSGDLQTWKAEDDRTFSAFRRGTPRYDAKGGMTTRRFNRVWISIVPDSWFRMIL